MSNKIQLHKFYHSIPCLILVALLIAACGDSPTATPVLATVTVIPATTAPATTAAASTAVAATPTTTAATPTTVPATTTAATTAATTTAAATSSGTFQQKYKSQDALDAFKAAGLEAEQPRPMTSQDFKAAPYVAMESIRFFIPSLGPDNGGRILSFATQAGLEATKAYYVKLGEGNALLFSWVFSVENILVQINGSLDDAKAGQYQKAFGKLGIVSSNAPTGRATPATTTQATTATAISATPTPEPPTATVVPPTATLEPTATPVPATNTPIPQAPAFDSGGIGLDKATWEKLHGPNANNTDTIGSYENKKYFILFSSGKIFNLTRQNSKLSNNEARIEAKSLMPKDAKLVKTYTDSRSGVPVDLYYSEALKNYLGSSGIWSGGEPGNFIVKYNSGSYIVATGNTP